MSAAFRVGKPYTHVRLTGNKTLTGASQLDFPWDEVAEAEGVELWSAADPAHFTVSHDGLWLAAASISRATIAAAQRFRVRWLINDANDGHWGVEYPASTAMAAGTVTLCEHLVAGTTLKVVVWGAAAPGAVFAADGCEATVARIGPKRWT